MDVLEFASARRETEKLAGLIAASRRPGLPPAGGRR